MKRLNNLAYFGLGVSNLEAWASFATDILGLQIAKQTSEYITLRMDEYCQRIFLVADARDDLLVAGWSLNNHEDLDAYVAQLRAKGVEVRELDADERALRSIERGYSCMDPNGFAHEFSIGLATAELKDTFHSSVLKSRFVVGDLGVGHLLPFCKDLKETVSFYTDVLGLRISDYIREEIAPGIVADATFFHSETGRHHSIATAAAPAERVLNHFMLEVADIDDVGLAYERVRAAGIPVALSLGHHPNDKMFSFYAQTPSGFNFEFGWGGVVIEDVSNWSIKNYTEMSDWGHERLLAKMGEE